MASDDVGFLFKTMIERDPKKRRVKPIESAHASLLDFDLGESSDDSDFRIEDHCEESDDSLDSNGLSKKDQDDDSDDDSDDSDDDDDDDDDEEEDEEGELNFENQQLENGCSKSETNHVQKEDDSGKVQIPQNNLVNSGITREKLSKILVCCGCLGDRSDDVNEIVECDGCGVTVHEGCYGVSDVESFSSTDSSSQSAPWFCEACSAGIEDICCELCPNKGGIFKETDVGKWVHLVCALYVPGVAFGEVDKLTNITLFEMPYNKWGAKPCSLCEDTKFARTGVCIECDAGMCHTYFHVTCAQKEGLLSEAHSEEVDQADPFYAHCKLHSDKSLIRKRKKNWMALQLREKMYKQMITKPEHLQSEEYLRIQRKLNKHRQKYLAHRTLKPMPWVPDQKMPRMMTTSAAACRNLERKAELMGINVQVMETQEEQMASLADVHKKWHIPPAFNVEFISYFLDRNQRTSQMNARFKKLMETNSELLKLQQTLDQKYDGILKQNESQLTLNANLRKIIDMYHKVLDRANRSMPIPVMVTKPKPPQQPARNPIKIGVLSKQRQEHVNNSSISHVQNHLSESDKAQKVILQVRHQCGICRRNTDQHLLAKCDTCHLHYHLSCLNPPLTRMPKKTKSMGWQCSECDKESSSSEVEGVDTTAPRRLRQYRDASKSFEEMEPESKEMIVTNSTNSIKRTYSESFNDSPNTNCQKIRIKSIEDKDVKKEIAASEYDFCPIRDTMTIKNEQNPEYRMASYTENFHKLNSNRNGKKRRREKHKRYSPDMISGSTKQRKRKHKRKNAEIELDGEGKPQEAHRRITIKIKPIPLPQSSIANDCTPTMVISSSSSTVAPSVAPSESYATPTSNHFNQHVSKGKEMPASLKLTPQSAGSGRKSKGETVTVTCIVCSETGTNQNSVECDECKKSYHFTCLDPPVKKSPKRRGYSWHCADCDPSASELEN
ncbi:PHD finger protein 14 [Trichogramma pretiosum]|uniref:PHD finger protein 14 n=1 Tax=Trichogramma pretiosum TaxID=7493 RepID=UPI0006C99DFE|nr:PHD finger protein 14 [Trichogramma pretiosum]